MTIVRRGALASAALLLAACHGAPRSAPDPTATPVPITVRTLAPGDAFLLEDNGDDPADTVAWVVPGRPRTIVVRRPPPDNTVFATLDIPAGGLTSGPDSVKIDLTAAPGVYGLTIGSDASFGPGITLTFKYAVHFAAPAAALARYGTIIQLEHQLAIARRNDDGSLAVLASGRPAGDNLSALINTPGTYLVVAPK